MVQKLSNAIVACQNVRMDHDRDTDRIPASKAHAYQQPSSGRDTSPRMSPYNNPSLDRYTDLRKPAKRRKHRRWVIALAIVLVVLAAIPILTMSAIYITARNDQARSVDAIVVMGAAQYNGRPSPVLEARLERALELYQQGFAPMMIVTGGNQPGDVYTEGGTSQQWMIDRGVPENAILVEDSSNNTWDSWQGVKRLAESQNIHSVLIVSDGFHLFRSERMAEAVGFDAYGSPATNSPIRPWSGDEFGYVIRETAATLVQIPDWLF